MPDERLNTQNWLWRLRDNILKRGTLYPEGSGGDSSELEPRLQAVETKTSNNHAYINRVDNDLQNTINTANNAEQNSQNMRMEFDEFRNREIMQIRMEIERIRMEANLPGEIHWDF